MMALKKTPIPVNQMIDELGKGISVERISFGDSVNTDPLVFEEGKQPHRHDGHSFFLLESGTVTIEIDFQKYKIRPHSVIYIHPDQVHRTTTFENIVVSNWSLSNQCLNPEYLKLLEGINPGKPISLSQENFSLIAEAVTLSLKFAARRQDKLYHSLLNDSCNVLVGLVISQYLIETKSNFQPSRYETVNKAFRELLERNFTSLKRPVEYAEKLSISIPYLNECVKNATGYTVSHHIQQRIILEAKRLLYYSQQSVKEISAALGYDDYPYFSRLFRKVTGMTAMEFRNKNHV